MQVAPIAILVCAMLLAIGAAWRAPAMVALFASFAFGSTAIAILPALGGASFLLYVPLACLLILECLFRPSVWRDMGRLLRRNRMPAIVLLLLAYTLAGAFVMPRLFAGATTVFVPSRGAIVETALMPVSGNINQSVYFTLGIVAFFAIAVRLSRDGSLVLLRTGFFAFAIAHTLLGLIDFAGKASGAGDLLEPIRTAGYSMLIEVQVGGFWRIVGGYPEASTFAGGSLVVLAFTFSYWRGTGSRLALWLSIVVAVLLLLCTSTTGYVGLLVLVGCLGLSWLLRAGAGRMGLRDLGLATVSVLLVTLVLGIMVFGHELVRPVEELFVETLVNKSTSSSAEERMYWNAKSWMAMIDTYGLGVGIGSSRASSSILAMLSQLGVVGSGLVAVLVLDMLRPLPPAGDDPFRREQHAISGSLRTTALATIVPAAIAGGGADPGIVFFMAVSGVMVGRNLLSPDPVKGASRGAGWRPAGRLA